MTDKTIKELIAEARELGVDIHNHVAQEMYGTVNVHTRHQAKAMTFCKLYGGTGRASSTCPSPQNISRRPDADHPWKMTEEQVDAYCKAMSLEFKQLWMNEPFKAHEDLPAMEMRPTPYLRPMAKHPQAEDRMHRVGVVPYKIEVLDTTGGGSTLYTVHATSALDARCMAFVLYDRYEAGLAHWDDGHVELALSRTEIVE